jgi:hypothetical protein
VGRRRFALLLLAAALQASGCLGADLRERSRIHAALADLQRADREFEADVRFARNPNGVCDGLACARVAVIGGHRTIQLAPGAFKSDAKLRASLLEIWERYRQPRTGSTRDLARGALRIVTDGPSAGVDDAELVTQARRVYRRHYQTLSRSERKGLPAPETLPR